MVWVQVGLAWARGGSGSGLKWGKGEENSGFLGLESGSHVHG